MLQILLHSSKTMASNSTAYKPLDTPLFKDDAAELATILRKASTEDLVKVMHISSTKAEQVKLLYDAWSPRPSLQSPAIDAFKGDIYSGLQVGQWSDEDREYAHEHLVILSGLYGALRACDGIMPYRLEMGYKLPSGQDMYSFWGNKLAQVIYPKTQCIINLSAVEYTKAILPFIEKSIITPKFMTISPKTGEPEFVVVHAKIARGAFARWLVQEQIENPQDLRSFKDLGYAYDSTISTPEQPVFICKVFQGIGLSVRITATK